MFDSNDPRDLRNYFDHVYWPRKLGKSPKTAALYRLTLARFAEFLGRASTLDDLTDATLCAFVQSRLDMGRAEHTVDKERDKLVALANFAARKRHIDQFPDVPPLTPAEIEPRCWRDDELTALLAACRSATGRIGDAAACDWWYAFHILCLLTGERTGAMLVLRWEWLGADGWLRVPGAARKGRKAASYQLPDIALQALAPLPRGERVFDGFRCKETFYLHYGRLLKHAGLPSGRRFKPQALRRTFASYLERAGGDATDALQHTSRAVTRQSYLDPTVCRKTAPSLIVAPAYRFKSG